MNEQLQKLLNAGAIITLPRLAGARMVLAAASIQEQELWFFPVFGDRDHAIAFDSITEVGTNINLLSGSELVASLCPLEFPEDQEQLAAWKQFLQTPEGQTTAEAIAEAQTAL